MSAANYNAIMPAPNLWQGYTAISNAVSNKT
jgi:hypothetical protein